MIIKFQNYINFVATYLRIFFTFFREALLIQNTYKIVNSDDKKKNL